MHVEFLGQRIRFPVSAHPCIALEECASERPNHFFGNPQRWQRNTKDLHFWENTKRIKLKYQNSGKPHHTKWRHAKHSHDRLALSETVPQAREIFQDKKESQRLQKLWYICICFSHDTAEITKCSAVSEFTELSGDREKSPQRCLERLCPH